jgi:hypothetical protein
MKKKAITAVLMLAALFVICMGIIEVFQSPYPLLAWAILVVLTVSLIALPYKQIFFSETSKSKTQTKTKNQNESN